MSKVGLVGEFVRDVVVKGSWQRWADALRRVIPGSVSDFSLGFCVRVLGHGDWSLYIRLLILR